MEFPVPLNPLLNWKPIDRSPFRNGLPVIPPDIPYPLPYTSLYESEVDRYGLHVLLNIFLWFSPNDNTIPPSL